MVGLEIQLDVARVTLPQALRPQDLDRPAEQLCAGVAEQLLRERVDEHDATVTRGGDDGVRKTLQHRRRSKHQPCGRIRAIGGLL